MPVNVTSVRVGGGEAALVPTRAATDSDSSQGRAIETPSPRSRVRREMVEADVMCIGCILLGGCCFNRSRGLSVQRYDGLEVRRTCYRSARRTGSPSYVLFACPVRRTSSPSYLRWVGATDWKSVVHVVCLIVRRTSSPSYNFNRPGNPNQQPASLDVSIVSIVRPECPLFWDSGRCIVQPSKDVLHLERCGRSSRLPKELPLF